jgi:voltage-gated potassium channel
MLLYRIVISFKRRAANRLRIVFYLLRRNQFLKISFAILLLALLAAIGVVVFEYSHNSQFKSVGDGLWWAMVTISTVGYGDKVPATSAGRLLAVILMFSGVALFSFFTASVSSLFVTSRLKEGRGLLKVGFRNHIAILGWNSYGEKIIHAISEDAIRQNRSVVLINQSSADDMQEILHKYHALQIKFVFGDIADELVLNRANLRYAYAAIIIPDESCKAREKCDERTVLATLSVKAIEPRVKVIAHILSSGNESHLRRANADHIVHSDQYSGYLLGAHVIAPGIPELLDSLLNGTKAAHLTRRKVPSSFIGKSFAELAEYLKKSENSILLGFVTEEPAFQLDDILSDDYSAIDNFIRKKLEQAGKGLAKKAKIDVNLNPPYHYQIQDRDIAVIIEGV